MQKNPRQEWKVYKNVFDQFTLQVLEKLRGQGHYDELKSPIALGKEANIFSAVKGSRESERKVIVKIYRLENCNFNKMYSYLAPDPRFHDLKKKRRLIIFTWAQREYRNLLKARDVIRVPMPIAVRDNVIIMEHIGRDEAAPKLKDALPSNPKKFYDKTIANMKALHKAGLVHADLSDFNILNYEDEPVFIDFSQGTTTEHPHADEYLERDLRNVCRYFKRLGLKIDEKKELKKITK
ncbi:serine protein kinase RIO [Candidatus Woesearchaeota archaeon]|nr:serine protein kinase RIO [Candidatus Woesearchaeota archaeon]